MTDTPNSIAIRFHQMIMERSGIEWLKIMGCSMFDTAKHIVRSSIIAKNSQISESEMKKEVFLRFYGQDFSPEHREKILKALK